MTVLLANAAAWLRERSLWVVLALVAAVGVLSFALRSERINRRAAEAMAKWEREISDSNARRRVRVEAAQARREVDRASTLRDKVMAANRADERRKAIYSAGDDLGKLFDRTFRAGRRH